MYEQFLYFWFVWMVVIIIAFFMEDSKKRTFLFIWSLLILFMSEKYLFIGSIQLSIAFVVFIIGAIIFYVHQSFTTYTIIVTFSVMIGYVGLLIWDKITPVWFVMPTYFITPIMTVALITALVNSFYSQITIALVGASFGQVIFDLLLISYRLHHMVGEKVFFIHMSVTILLLVVLRFIYATLRMFHMIRKRKVI